MQQYWCLFFLLFSVSVSASRSVEKDATITQSATVAAAQPSAVNTSFRWQGNALFRYEDAQFNFRNDIQRLRFIGNLGLQAKRANWSGVARLTTGLKNKQNVPAITLVKFNQQPQPDSDLYLDRLFVQYQSQTLGQFRLGKQPWMLTNVTDTFWDRHLHPIGFSWQGKQAFPVTAALLAPLDGASDTVGRLLLLQGHFTTRLGEDWSWELHPWWVQFEGADAEFATRDTALDHQSLRLTMLAKRANWQLGVDVAQAVDAPEDGFGDHSIATQLTYGKLREVGTMQWHVRYVHTERYAVITEFAQNAIAGFSTSNIKGFDVRYRYKVMPRVWFGLRYSDIESIRGNDKAGTRFRIELGMSL